MESSTKNGRRKDKIRADGVARPNKSQSSSRRKETQHGAGMTITTVEENETIGDGDTGLGTLLENDSNSGEFTSSLKPPLVTLPYSSNPRNLASRLH